MGQVMDVTEDMVTEQEYSEICQLALEKTLEEFLPTDNLIIDPTQKAKIGQSNP